MIVHDTTPPLIIQPQETRINPDWNALYFRHCDEYKRQNPKASKEELDWYAQGMVDDARGAFASVAG